MSAPNPFVVVVGIDYSQASSLVFAAALRAASQRTPSELHIINVMSLLTKQHRSGEPRLSSDAEARARALGRLKRFVASELAAQRAKREAAEIADFDSVVSHVRTQAPGVEIAQLAADLDADLVVVGNQGNDGAAHLLLGSVAHQVIVLAPCPVLVVRQKTLNSMAAAVD